MVSIIVSAIKIIFLLGFLIGIHETGHFLVAKLCKVRVNEFAIGFGPTIWKKQGKETKYAIRLIPLGGFVSMEGEEEHSDKEGSFSKASIPKRIAIVMAGATVNIVFALVVYFILSANSGSNVTTIINEIMPGYAAEQAGLQPGDEIVKINNKKVKISTDVINIVTNSNGNELTLEIKRKENYENIVLSPTMGENSTYYLGVIFKKADNNFFNNIYYAFFDTGNFIVSIADSVKQIFTGKLTTDQLMGPVGISEVVTKTSGLTEFIYMLALVSMSLGVTNLIPFPPLDGGKILFLIIEGIRRKPLNEEIEVKIQLLGFAILITLSLYITYNDILRIF